MKVPVYQMGIMARHLLAVLLVAGLVAFGMVPHAAMAGQVQDIGKPCHMTHGEMMQEDDGTPPAGHADHNMVVSCAGVCLASIAMWIPHADAAPMVLSTFRYPVTGLGFLDGQPREPDERPPKSV